VEERNESVITGTSLMYHESLAGGKDFEDVQLRAKLSPASYSS